MNIDDYREIKPGKKVIKRLYISIMLWIVGRAIQVAAAIDRDVREEFENLRDDFTLSMGVIPGGPFMIVGKDKEGRVRYQGWKKEGKKITLDLGIKNMEAAFLVFTFQESTAVAFAHDRFIVDGDLGDSLAVARILDLVEVFLLPKIAASLAVKRYPRWSELSPGRKWLNRLLIYVRIFTSG